MCWFVIDSGTGKHLDQVDMPTPGDQRLYLHNLALDSFFDTAGAFEQFLAPHSRPPFEDLVSFVVDGVTPKSMAPLAGPKLDRHRKAIQNFWTGWDAGEDGYEALLGRPMLREEKYWLVHEWLCRLAVGREQFYEGKTVRREQWLVDWRGWDGQRWKRKCRGRLRVFSDGSADAWYPAVGVSAFDKEEDARRHLDAAGFGVWEEIKAWLGLLGGPDPPAPPVSQADDTKGPFRYRGEY